MIKSSKTDFIFISEMKPILFQKGANLAKTQRNDVANHFFLYFCTVTIVHYEND